jgi:hypothetical protein
MWSIFAPLGKPRLVRVLARAAVYAALVAALALAVWWAAGTVFLGLLIAPLGLVGLLVLIPAGFFVYIEWALLFGCYRKIQERYARLKAESLRIVALDRATVDAKLANPAARKYTADLEAAGFTYLGDVRTEPLVYVDTMTRVFLAPDGVTYLQVAFTLSSRADPDEGVEEQTIWPAGVGFQAHTDFEIGGVTSTHQRDLGFLKKRSGPEQIFRVFVGADDPLELVRLHREVVLEFAKETGRAPLGHERFDQFVRRQNDNQDEERRLYADAPYTWGDHLHWYLQILRREYRL